MNTKAKKYQRGFADGLVPLMTLIIYGVGFAMLAVAISSVAITAKVSKQENRSRNTIIVIGLWMSLLFYPKLNDWLRSYARTQCQKNLPNLPSRIETDGFYDEAAGLSKGAILHALSDRSIKYIEIKPQNTFTNSSGDVNGGKRVALPNGDGEQSWTIPNSFGEFVRLELGKQGDLACLKSLPYGVETFAQSPPFLPNSCIKIESINQPT